jgi:RNA polymerase subunit RPABC4/transcription elongation factor Spt4
MSKLIKCKHCNHECAHTADKCPQCGGKPTDDVSHTSGVIIIIIIIAGFWFWSQKDEPVNAPH